MKTAQEIAREMVPEPDAVCRRTIGAMVADVERDALRAVIVRCIEQRDAEHVAAERERAKVTTSPCSSCGCADPSVAPSWCSCGASDVQPRDLAGRIRELIQAKAGEWADTRGASERKYCELALLRDALWHVQDGGCLVRRIEKFRDLGSPESNHIADELEAIARAEVTP